jgi:hypothetical protein
VASQTGTSMSTIPISLQPTQARDISGEWARPTMLEMAGGEPTSMQPPEASQHERTPLSDGDDNLRSRRPWSSGAAADSPANNSRTARETNPSRHSADALPTEEAATANRRLSSASKQPVSLIAASPLADAHSLVTPSASATTEAAKLDNDSASKSGADESVYAEVYDQLGTSDASGAQAAFKLDSWRDSWKATPLLMILALERIAAGNTRRAKRESPCHTGRSRSHALGATDPTDAV